MAITRSNAAFMDAMTDGCDWHLYDTEGNHLTKMVLYGSGITQRANAAICTECEAAQGGRRVFLAKSPFEISGPPRLDVTLWATKDGELVWRSDPITVDLERDPTAGIVVELVGHNGGKLSVDDDYSDVSVFTWDDVDLLRSIAKTAHLMMDNRPDGYWIEEVAQADRKADALADRIAALLPPRPRQRHGPRPPIRIHHPGRVERVD